MPACKILIIDDDDDIRESLIALLRGEGYDVEGARSGLAALTMLTWGTFHPDIILLDLMMPNMTGEQFRVVLQKNTSWTEIPLILCTAGEVPDHVSAGCFDVLQKPFDLNVLFDALRRGCAKRGLAAAN